MKHKDEIQDKETKGTAVSFLRFYYQKRYPNANEDEVEHMVARDMSDYWQQLKESEKYGPNTWARTNKKEHDD